MSPAVRVILGIIIAGILVVGSYALFHKNGYNAASPTTSTSPATTSQSVNSSSSPANIAATITFSDSGFSPASVTVKSGETIRFTNSSKQLMQIDSNPHPAHTDNTELNIGTVEAGSSKTVTLTTKGTWGYHDHLNPSMTGTIHVE